ncbi:MAG: extracellular solute-binding protein [Acidobacteriota bacterium]|nr:extracellular solute-binding protein [Acidobacteriota bacterium]
MTHNPVKRSSTESRKARRGVPRAPRSPMGLLMGMGLAMLAAVGCGDGRTTVTVYSPHGRDLLELLEQAYEEQNPTIDVRWLDMGSQEVYDRVRFERNNPQADVWFGGPDTIFSRGAEEGLLAAFRPTWADSVPAASQAPGDLYFGVYLACPVLIYNSAALSDEEAPQDWDDLLDPRWKDQIIIRDPLASGTMRTAFGMILARSIEETGDTEQGWQWLRRLDAQTKEYALNPALLFEKLIRQEGLVSIWELTDILLLERRGSPLRHHFASSGTPVIDDSIGLVEGAPNPEAAKAFIEWVGGEQALALVAEKVFRLPARSDLPPESLPQWAQEVLAEMRPADVDGDLIAERGAEWMETWDRTVRGQGSDQP